MNANVSWVGNWGVDCSIEMFDSRRWCTEVRRECHFRHGAIALLQHSILHWDVYFGCSYQVLKENNESNPCTVHCWTAIRVLRNDTHASQSVGRCRLPMSYVQDLTRGIFILKMNVHDCIVCEYRSLSCTWHDSQQKTNRQPTKSMEMGWECDDNTPGRSWTCYVAMSVSFILEIWNQWLSLCFAYLLFPLVILYWWLLVLPTTVDLLLGAEWYSSIN